MYKFQQAKLMMYLLIKGIINTANSLWAGNIPFTASFGLLSGLITQLEAQRTIQENPITGITADKKAKKDAAFVLGWATMNHVKSWAVATNNAGVLGKLKYTESQMKSATGVEYVGILTTIYNTAQDNVGSLSTYGVTPTTQTAYLASITAFSNVLTDPMKAEEARAIATENIATLEGQIDVFLETRMDVDMENYRLSQPDFYNQYFNSRVPVKPGVNKRALELTVIDSVTHLPIAKVVVTYDDAPKKHKTSAKGISYMQNLTQDSHTVHLSLIGYVNKSQQFNVISGETTKLTVQLVKTS